MSELNPDPVSEHLLKPTTASASLPVRAARDALTVRRVFGEPYETEAGTVIPVAKVVGGSGMGFGTGVGNRRAKAPEDSDGKHPAESTGGGGGGGGFGVTARPAGVYVISGSRLRWQPALDLNRVILGGQLVGAVAVVALAWAWRSSRGR